MEMQLAVSLLVLGLCAGAIYGDDAEHISTTCPCGQSYKRGKIVDGTPTPIREYPFMLQVVTLNDMKTVCGAVILTASHALTATHCTRSVGNEPIAVVAGVRDQREAGTQIVKVSRIQEHVAYNERTLVNDIAVLFLETPLTFNQNVGPVCMPPRNSNPAYVKIIGWEESGSFPVQKEVDARVGPTLRCRQSYRQYAPNPLFPTQICTFQRGKGACIKNSGSPVVYLDTETNRYTLIGVVSYGNSECDPKLPTVETDVSVYMPWIEDVVKSPLCQKVSLD